MKWSRIFATVVAAPAAPTAVHEERHRRRERGDDDLQEGEAAQPGAEDRPCQSVHHESERDRTEERDDSLHEGQGIARRVLLSALIRELDGFLDRGRRERIAELLHLALLGALDVDRVDHDLERAGTRRGFLRPSRHVGRIVAENETLGL